MKRIAALRLQVLLQVATLTVWATVSAREPLLDRSRDAMQSLIETTAESLDRLSGLRYPPERYQLVTGTISTALQWTEFDGMHQRVRFRVDLPVPGLDERFRAFAGRVNRDQLVENEVRNRTSGPLTRSGDLADQTVAGIAFAQARSEIGQRFDGGLGVRLRFPLDPYIKGGWQWVRPRGENRLLSWSETAFWQHSEGLGLTSRLELSYRPRPDWLVTWYSSATFSQKSAGLRGYSAVEALRPIGNDRAWAFEVGLDGETDAEVPLTQYGLKAAYRVTAVRQWLVFEFSGGVNWARELQSQPRKASWGVGLGVEMLLGEAMFEPRPITF